MRDAVQKSWHESKSVFLVACILQLILPDCSIQSILNPPNSGQLRSLDCHLLFVPYAQYPFFMPYAQYP